MKFTDEQQNALDARGRVLVSAAAGSGKTAVLVEKVIGLISDENNPIDIDKLLVVTFTNAAAAEMKARISKRLSEKLKENPDNFHLRKQKLLLSSAPISTIDSLCISLAREYFYKLGIPCDFKIADKSVIDRLKNDAIDTILAEKFELREKPFLDLVSIFGGERADEKLKENIFKVYDYLCSLPFPDIYIEKVSNIYSDFDENSVLFDVVFSYATDIVKNGLMAFKPAYEQLLEDADLSVFYGEAFREVNEKLLRALKLCEERDYSGIRHMLQFYTNAEIKQARKYSNTEFKEKMKSAKKKAEGTFEKLSKVFNCSLEDVKSDMKMLKPLIDEFFSLTKEFSKHLYELKLENNSFVFDDIENEVLKLLARRENGEVFYTSEAKELSSKYHAVLVDEHQDTNDLQNTIFNALSDDGKKLFMVGDVKQSIYGFRKANPKNFLKARNELPLYEENSEKSKVVMSGNFRSCADVCDFVNFLFYRLLTPQCGEMYYDEEDKLVPKATFQPIDKKRVSIDIITATDDNLSAVEKQAYHIADVIEEKLNSGEIITEGDTLRKAEYKDVCILLRGKAEIPVFAQVFKERNIPLFVDNNEGLLDEKEIVTLFSLLQVIDNPFSEVPLLSTLTSDIYNFTADEIARLRSTDKKAELYRVLLENKEKDQKVADFINQIEKFREISAISSVSSLINKILTETGYENIVYLYENGEACFSNLLLFKETARAFEEGSGRGLSSFVGYIKRQIKNGNKMQKAILNSENDNAVKIMTMHRSKGLQFPICILACLNKRFNRDDSRADVILTEKCGLGLNFIDKNRKIKYSTFPRSACAIEVNALSQSEEMRLLYVAMTRAKDFLIMVGEDEKLQKHVCEMADTLTTDELGRFQPYFVQNCNDFLSMIIAGAISHKCGQNLRDFADMSIIGEGEGEIQVNIIDEINCDTDDEAEDFTQVEFDEQKYQQISEALDFCYPYKDLNKIFVKQSASGLAHKDFSNDFAFSSIPLFLQSEKLSAAEKGTAMHKFMQYCDFKAAAISISEETKRLTAEGKLTSAEALSLKEENLKAFFESDIGKRVVNSQNVFREQSFMIEADAKAVYKDLGDEFENEKVIVQGFADLCFYDGEGLFIIDYKTDRADEEELIKRYKLQLDIYSLALSQVFEREVTGTAIYSFYNKKLIEL